MKKLLLSLLVLSLGTAVFGQRVIEGTVTSTGGDPLIGANITVPNDPTIGTITDFEGAFSLEVPDGTNELIISYLGYESKTIELGSSNTVEVILSESGVLLDEAIVTAMGVERERKELGYSVTTVDNEDLTKVRTSNVVSNLSGRVAGVRVNSSSGTAGGSFNIQIRGMNNLGGGNQPLFVVDGVPISNSSFNGSRNEIIAGGADVGNRAGDLNPDDIESMTILKGASAVALYGQRARDGVIMVKTKRAKGQGVNVEINSSIRSSNPMRLPDFQNEYASGSFGEYDMNNFTNGWGPKISTLQNQLSSGELENINHFPYQEPATSIQAHPDNVSNFFQNGLTFINNVAVSQRSDKGDIRVSFTNLDEEGIIPANQFTRNTVSINGGTSLNEKLRVRGVVNYVRSEGLNRPRQGSNNPNILLSGVYGLPRTISNEALKNNLVNDEGQTIGLDGNSTSNNPYYIVENNPLNNVVDRVYGNVELNYDVTDWWNVMGRMGTDFYQEERRNITSKNTINLVEGQFIDRSIYRREFNTDVISTFNFDLTSDIKLNAFAGWNVNQIEAQNTRVTANDLVVSNLYNPANALVTNNARNESMRRLIGLYGDIGLSYKDYLFVNVMARNDWSSTLPKDNNSYFYPGVSASFIFSEALDINKDILSFGKIRASIANVGSDVAPYSLDFLFTPATDIFTQFVPNVTYPFGGNSVFVGPDVLPPGNALMPQNQNTFEVGTELQFFKGRFGVDFTYYNTVTSNQILNVQLAQSTGFDAELVNAGEVQNSGIEVMLNLTPVQTDRFSWTILGNFTQNRQEVLELAPGLDDIALTSGFSGLSIRAEEGEAFGLYGAGWARSPEGDVIINSTTGLRERGDRTRLGNILPDFMYGVENVFQIGGVTVSALIDASVGGVMFSRTVSSLRGSGLAAETLEGRGETFIDKGVNEVVDGEGNVTYVENNVPVRSMQDFWGNYTNNSNTEGSVFGADYVKLREVTVSYTLPRKWLSGTFIESVSVGFEGRNLLLLDSAVPHIDPEASFFGPSLAGGAANIEFFSVPTARTFGGNIRVKF